MQVLKFGGTSVANSDNMSKVVSITTDASKRERTIIVCSAISGCTDALIEIGRKAASGDDSYVALIDNLELRHTDLISSFLTGKDKTTMSAECAALFATLREIAKGVFLIQEISEHSLATIESFGEILSTKIIHARFLADGLNAEWVDSRNIVRCNGGTVDTSITYAAAQKVVEDNPDTRLFIFPGFIASDESGKTVTLGRGGSDYSASLLAAALNASRLEIWTDVPGIMTTNPKLVKTARTIEHISYRAALELSHFGAKVIYPPTIHPVVASEIPIYVKDTFHPQAYGTKIEANPPRLDDSDSIGISNSNDIALISLEGSAMVGIPGFSARLFAALSNAGINIILITQASSVHTMCLAISEKDATKAKSASDECFAYEISLGKIKPLKVETGYSIVCLVGDNVIGRSGATGKMLAALGRRGIQVRATAQGSSERNISVIVPSEQVDSAIKSIHNEFFDDSNENIINLYIAGFGTIGKALVKMISENTERITNRTGNRIRICGIANTRTFVIDDNGLDLTNIDNLMENGSDASNNAYFSALAGRAGYNTIFVDCTASREICDNYMFLIENRYNIVACNKIFFSSSYGRYKAVMNAAAARGLSIKYETTVGAAIPVLESLSRCYNSGDTLVKVEAVLSGTLNYLCTHYEGGDFNALVEEARLKGYTEPNPNDDLSGRDVLRKLVILSREAGFKVDEQDVKLEPFPVDEVKARYEAAKANGMKLRYVATLEQDGETSIMLKEVSSESPLYNLQGTDNAAIITTTDYPSPLVVQGAGAGPRQTAGGILNDILSI